MTTKAERKYAHLASGKPLIVAPREGAKSTRDYRTDPEIILGCILVSGTLDTAEVLRAEICIAHGVTITDAQKMAHIAFRRVWATPTGQERAEVLDWAQRIASAFRHRKTRLEWNEGKRHRQNS